MITLSRRIFTEQPENWQGKYVLKCTHSLNRRSEILYLMYCDVIKQMPNNRLKVRVYGERYKSIEGNKIRYVPAEQVDIAADWNI
ncbi:Uncharacterised protein [Neisseria zoodegmatis]|uniref:WYL domain-containing protein n=1 Tax=Neisseria zoodegmatis TaxID=326523 RepID=A0AB38DSH7_9NEIS|nr:hypothetical protein BWD10_03370 [Neisseria zoodegmatis]SNU80204.1 Uncharacterised protein [Neisseria zoodegmatis]